MRSIALALAVSALAACSQAPSQQQRIETDERAAMAPLKTHYPDVVMGFDFHGPVVDVSVDLNAEMQLDDSKDEAMKAEAVRLWRNAWMQSHPGEHARLTVRVLDFRGNVDWKGTAKA